MRAGTRHFRTVFNISSFARNATPDRPDDESGHPRTGQKIYPFISMACGALELAEQQQDQQHDQNNAAETHAGVAHAIAIAAKPAAEAAQQENNQDDDEY